MATAATSTRSTAHSVRLISFIAQGVLVRRQFQSHIQRAVLAINGQLALTHADATGYKSVGSRAAFGTDDGAVVAKVSFFDKFFLRSYGAVNIFPVKEVVDIWLIAVFLYINFGGNGKPNK